MSFLRTIEKRIRRAVLNTLGKSGRIGPDDLLPFALPEAPRILLLRIDRIGDAIISTPALQRLRRRFPEGRIDILLSERNSATAPLLPAADTAYVLARKFSGILRTIGTLRRNRYHVIVNLHLNRSASASTVGSLARAGIVIESPEQNAFAGHGDHVVPMTARLLKPLGVEAITPQNEQENPLRLELPAESVRRAENILRDLLGDESTDSRAALPEDLADVILINVSATHDSRNWPGEHYIALARELRRGKMIPVICGAPGDAGRVQDIAAESGALPLPPLQNYADFAAVTARAAAVITPDTSTVHLSAALGRPTVCLYGSERTAHAWRPWGVPHRILLNPEGTKKIQPEEVVAALAQLLRRDTKEGQSDHTERTEIPTRSV